MELPINKILCGDNLETVRQWPDNCIDAIVTDPPYGLGFMGKDWDTFKGDYIQKGLDSDKSSFEKRKNKTFDHKALGSPTQIHSPAAIAGQYDYSRNAEFQAWFTMWAKEMLRIAKPGAFLLCFGGTRTYHRLTCAIEDGGWQIRDCMMWLYGSGFPKSLDISKAIDKAKGCIRPRVPGGVGTDNGYSGGFTPGEAISGEAIKWNGWGTALKPAWEPIVVAMKPCDGTFAENAEKYGVAGINIDGCRIEGNWNRSTTTRLNIRGGNFVGATVKEDLGHGQECHSNGRWPANVILDEQAAAMLDEQSGELNSNSGNLTVNLGQQVNCFGKYSMKSEKGISDSGGASRFFYCAKSSRSERDMGFDELPLKETGTMDDDNCQWREKPVGRNNHPTVKPLSLMEYLCKLVKPPAGGLLLDPFAGSGTTLLAAFNTGWDFIGIEKEKDYCLIAEKRLEHIKSKVGLFEKV